MLVSYLSLTIITGLCLYFVHI